jgi:uncharacterized protein YfaS (alpha-2-macroglobulin family)
MKQLICLIFLFSGLVTFSQNRYAIDWQKVDSLSNIGQPQSALEIVNRIYTEAKTSGETNPFIKATLYKIKLEADFQEDFYKTAIERTNAEIARAKSPNKQILSSILAELYWRYFQNNRWNILNRSETANFVPDDLATWDTRKLVAASMENYAQSLTDKDLLKTLQISSFDEILIRHEDSEKFRPTLFDFLAFRAVEFYSSNDAGLTTPANTFSINNESYFSAIADFLNLDITSPDSFSFDFHALKLLQEVITLHQNDAEPTALIDADLSRLNFVHEKSTLPEKDSLYLAALTELQSRYSKHEASAEIDWYRAQLLNGDDPTIPYSDGDDANNTEDSAKKWNKKKAVEICQEAISRFSESFGGKNCKALLESIQQPSLSVTVSNAIPAQKPSLALVSYRNTPKMYFRLLKVAPETERDLREKDNESRFAEYLKLKPATAWEQTLPDDGDYREHSAEVKIPALAAGHYVLLASNNSEFPKKSVVVVSATFWCSNISYITCNNDANKDVIVVHRETGQPLAGITVQPFFREYSPKTRKMEISAGEKIQTDKNGLAIINPKNKDGQYLNYYLEFSSKSDLLITEEYFNSYYYRKPESKPITQTHFFTDRAIYRPGQTIYFKGIVLERKGDDVKIKTHYSTEVSLFDANNQLVAKQTLTTNDFGSFAGSFSAPQNVLTGQMYIRCETGSAYFQVEEYKCPKFEVNFEPVKGSYKFGKPVTVTGKAMAYAGSSVSGGKVKYRVVREIHFPYFWNVGRYMSRQTSMELTNGEAETAADGSFQITFDAIPDNSFNKKNQPIFSYTVKAEVTDINGETHEAETSVSVGYQSLLIATNLPEEINLDKGFQFSLSTTNLNGEKEKASGTIKITKLQSPDRVLYARKWNRPDRFTMTRSEFEKIFPNEVYDNETDGASWAKSDVVFSKEFNTVTDSLIVAPRVNETGKYLVEIKSRDLFGTEVSYERYVNTFVPKDEKSKATFPARFRLLTPSVQPGENAKILMDVPVKKTRIMYEITQGNLVHERLFIDLNDEQKVLNIPVKEEYRGNFSVNLLTVKNNRIYKETLQVQVPFSNKKLDVQFASFRSKLMPGQNEEWQITLKDSKGENAAGELLASMYDASLDQFKAHEWNFAVFNYHYAWHRWESQSFSTKPSIQFFYPEFQNLFINREYNQLNWFGFNFIFGDRRMFKMASARGAVKSDEVFAVVEEAPEFEASNSSKLMISDDQVVGGQTGAAISIRGNGIIQKPEEPKPIQIRKNLAETAFFYPQLASNEKGEIVLKFKAPEALTRWKLMALAHTKDLKYGQIEKTLVTQKDLMVFVNAPRFLREGDSMEFAAKISNISAGDLSGTAELHFFDAFTMQPVDQLLNLQQTAKPFSAVKGSNASVSWKINIPEGLQAVVYRITASSGTFSDGEEAAIPVLTNRMLVTESLPLPVKGNQQKTFSFDKLLNSEEAGSTLKNYRLSLEFTSNPSWYAVQALPYLMEYPYECAEQLFSRYYANSLAASIANSNSKIKRVFESWKITSPDALKSKLERNEELKSVLLQESPWVAEAKNESEQKERIGILFDLNRMASEQAVALKKLADMQYENGGWPWFKGMPENRYITQHVVSGFAHLASMKVFNATDNSETAEMLRKAIAYLDETAQKEFDELKKNDQECLKNNHLGADDIQYLYARSYFLNAFPLEETNSEMVNYYLNQTEKFWNSQNNYLKAMMALYLNRTGKEKTAGLIMKSLKETALNSDEMGMYWRNNPQGWFWHQAPVETQAMLIEAFEEVANDSKSVEEMKTWLLKQKQTQNWKTTKATTEAVYALLGRGADLLASDKQAEITIGTEKVDPNKTDGAKSEAGTGYFKTSWDAGSIKPEMGKVTVSNPNPTVAWGAMYWQYFEQLDHITPAQTPLSLSKKLFRELNTPTGPVIEPITESTPIKVSDKIVVRVELRTDRDMEYVHLKDMRASAFEPVDVISGYRYQDGLGYYQSTRDASTNFFISWLAKGTYIFEYKLVASQKGEFSNGVTSVQCMYAPEFAAHSEGVRVKIE